MKLKIKILLVFVSLLMGSLEIQAQASAPLRLNFLNVCPDLDPITQDWTCLDETQAAQREEIFNQVWSSAYRAKVSRYIEVDSVDPWRNKRGDYLFGVRIAHGRIKFAAMPGCTHAMNELTKELKKREKAYRLTGRERR